MQICKRKETRHDSNTNFEYSQNKNKNKKMKDLKFENQYELWRILPIKIGVTSEFT